MPDRPPSPTDLVKRFDLLKKGRDNGSSNRPPATEPGLDPVESKVESWCHSYHKKRLEVYRKDRAVLTDRMKMKRPEKDADAMAEEDCQAMKSKVVTARTDLSRHREAVEEFQEKVQAVKEKHDLDETARPKMPESVARFAGTLVFLILLETLVNGFFFGDHVSRGLLGGTSIAVLISVVNVVGLGWVAGMLIRMTAHQKDLWRLSGVIGTVLVVAAAVLLNLFVAHFRDALPDDYPPVPDPVEVMTIGSPPPQANDRADSLAACLEAVEGEGEARAGREARCLLFKGQPFELDGFQSYMLMLVGLMMFGSATWKWWARQDPHPDFSQAVKDHDKAQHALDSYEGDLLEELDRDRQSAVKQQERHARLLDPLDHWDRADLAYNELCKRLEECREDAEDLEKSCRSAIASYRSANRAAPRTQPEPESWSAVWTATWRLPEAPARPNIGTRSEAKGRAEEANTVKKRRIKKLNDCYKECEIEIRDITRIEES